jgi:hypothetical protein
MNDWLEEYVGFLLGLGTGIIACLKGYGSFALAFAEIHMIWDTAFDNVPTLFISGLVGGLGGALAHLIRLLLHELFKRAISKTKNKKDNDE